jgi:hypothetical protein
VKIIKISKHLKIIHIFASKEGRKERKKGIFFKILFLSLWEEADHNIRGSSHH